jgi:hypothetical protein
VWYAFGQESRMCTSIVGGPYYLIPYSARASCCCPGPSHNHAMQVIKSIYRNKAGLLDARDQVQMLPCR